MLKIKKRSGEDEEFSRKKLEKSILSAGGNEKTARMIAEGTKHREELTTAKVRTRVITELKRLDHEACKRYEAYKKKPVAKPAKH